MTSRERVIAAMNHKTPDRCPIDLGACAQTGMNASTVYRLRRALGLDGHRIKIVEPCQMLGEIEDDLLKAVHGDVVALWNDFNSLGYRNADWKPFEMDDGTPVLMGGGFEYDVDARGDKLVYPCGDRSVAPSMRMPKGGSFFDSVDHSSEKFDMDADESDMRPKEDFKDDFKVATDEDARHWEKMSKELYEGTDYAVMGVFGGASFGDLAGVPGPALRRPKGIRTYQDWLMATVLFPDYIKQVFEIQRDVMLKNLEIYKQAVGERIQVVWISGTDFGTQTGAFCSAEDFRRMYKPYFKTINDWVHKNTGWKIFYHTCGCINELLDDFVDLEVDCLNPVQFSAMEPAGLSPQRIKELYGDKFTFWGGGVDTQRTLPFGTPQEVREQVAQRVGILNKNGGYVFNPIHNVVANVPADNLIAMYETVIGEKIG